MVRRAHHDTVILDLEFGIFLTCPVILYEQSMPLRKPRRLPRRYNRPVTKQTRKLALRRRKTRTQWKRERLRRWTRRAARSAGEWRRFILRTVLVGIFCALLLVLGLLLFSPAVRIGAIHIVRTDPRLDLEETALALSPLYDRHLVLVSPYEVEALLTNKIPDMEDVTIEKVYPQELRVTVTLTPLSMRLAIVSPDEESSFAKPARPAGGATEDKGSSTGSSLHIDFLTEAGYYVQVPASEEYDVLPLVRIVDWGARPLPGTPLLSPLLTKRMDEAEKILVNQFGQSIISRTAFLRGQEFHLELPGYTLWFDMKSPLEAHFQRYRTFLESLEEGESVRYVDLRLTNRVIYR